MNDCRLKYEYLPICTQATKRWKPNCAGCDTVLSAVVEC